MANPKNGLVRTGIAGLDAVLMGGIPRTNVILVQGTAGSGKTLLGMEFIYRGITQFDEPGIIVVFESNPDKLIRDAAAFGWNLQELQEQKSCKSSLPVPKCWIRRCGRPIACCWRPRSKWAPNASLSMALVCCATLPPTAV